MKLQPFLSFLAASAFCVILHSAQAGRATWQLNPGSSTWNTATNWMPNTVPNGASDVATFATSNQTFVELSTAVTVSSIVFSPGASAFKITCTPESPLTITGAGVINNSGVMQKLSLDQ